MGNTFTEPASWGDPEPVELNTSPFSDSETLFVSINASFLHVLRFHFASANRIVNPVLEALTYTGEPETTPLRIRMLTENPGNKHLPEIQILPLSTVTDLQNLPDLDRAGIVIRFNGAGDTGERRYIDILKGGVIARCRTPSEMLTYVLSEEVFRALMFYAPFVADDFGLAVCRAKQADPPKASQETGWFSAEIAVTWQKEIAWQKSIEAIY